MNNSTADRTQSLTGDQRARLIEVLADAFDKAATTTSTKWHAASHIIEELARHGFQITTPPAPLRLPVSMVRAILKGAMDAEDDQVIAACRRLLKAHRLGWNKYATHADRDLVAAFADAIE